MSKLRVFLFIAVAALCFTSLTACTGGACGDFCNPCGGK